ncbi:MAG: GspH/FimT family pseudopilin [Nitrospirota bacterium]
MSNHQGITFIELVIALSVAAVLVGVFGFSFHGWMGSYEVESQVKNVYADMMNARARAMDTNRTYYITITPDHYQICEDADDNEQYEPDIDSIRGVVNTKTLRYPSLWTGIIRVDHRGLVSGNPGPNGTIRFSNESSEPDYDCIVFFATRINIGKWDGKNCIVQ